MKRPVIAIGLDATDPRLLENWMDQGHLKHLAQLRARGGLAWVNNVDYYRTETSWITFLTGALPQQTGEWGHMRYDPERYAATEQSAYEFTKYPPFYATTRNRKVAVFDPPLARPVAGVNGIQVMGWGTEVNQCLRVSEPVELMQELIGRHGCHPLFESTSSEADTGVDESPQVLSYKIPSSYDVPALYALADRLCLGARRRAALMKDLLGRAPWDLFLGVFSETHTASHLLWHLSQEHPLLDSLAAGCADDPLRRVFQAVDESVGEVLASVPENAHVILFSIYGIAANVLDLPSMVFLPELLYRWSFPGEAALGRTTPGEILDAPRLNYPAHWKDEVWRLRTAGAADRLESPGAQERNGDPLHWQPTNWYRPLWPNMKAFALPTYSEGLIRINVTGRDGAGIISPREYGDTCDDICDYLSRVKDARSGRPMVRDIIRTRSEPFADHVMGPPADLIVLWQEEEPTDVVESQETGRIGPVPYFRSGGHCSQGFVLAEGPGIDPGSRLDDIHARDLTAILLDLLGQEPSAHSNGLGLNPWQRTQQAKR